MPGQKNLSFQDDTPQQIERIAQNKGWSQSKVVSKAVDLLDEESFEARAEGDLFEIKQRLSAIESTLDDGVDAPSQAEGEKKKESDADRTRDIPDDNREEIDELYRSETGVDLSEQCPANGNGLNKPERAQVFYELSVLEDDDGIIWKGDIDEAIQLGWGDASDHMVENYRPKVADRLDQDWIKIVNIGDTGVWVEDESLIGEAVGQTIDRLEERLNNVSPRDKSAVQQVDLIKRQLAVAHSSAVDYNAEVLGVDDVNGLVDRAEEFRKHCESMKHQEDDD